MSKQERALAFGGKLIAGILICSSYGAAQSTSPTLHYTTLYTFGGQPHDGALPNAPLAIGGRGTLFGTTYFGGPRNVGTVFALIPPSVPGGAWTEALLVRFIGTNGSFPMGPVTLGSDGLLYGTTASGGGSGDRGTVFSLSPPASPGGPWTETLLHTFSGASEDTDGIAPVGTLAIGNDGVIYAVASGGGGLCSLSDGCGVVFSLTPPVSPGGAWTENVLFHLADLAPESYATAGVVMGTDGVLYGSISETVFSVTPPAPPGAPWMGAAIYTFTGVPDGQGPSGVTIGDGGVLYGTTQGGGDFNTGTVFSLTPPASAGAPWTRTLLYTFGSSGAEAPLGTVAIGPMGVLYGATMFGGKYNQGVLFALEPPASPGGPWTYKEAHSFNDYPLGSFVLGHGALYGTTGGTVFSVGP
jgi:uncharacterized repeat protein (TIGR03803 family)